MSSYSDFADIMEVKRELLEVVCSIAVSDNYIMHTVKTRKMRPPVYSKLLLALVKQLPFNVLFTRRT